MMKAKFRLFAGVAFLMSVTVAIPSHAFTYTCGDLDNATSAFEQSISDFQAAEIQKRKDEAHETWSRCAWGSDPEADIWCDLEYDQTMNLIISEEQWHMTEIANRQAEMDSIATQLGYQGTVCT